jgi:chromosome segregation ATPase
LNGVSLNHTTLLAGLRTDVDSGSGSQADIAALQSDVSTINTTLASHDGRIFTNTTDVFQLQTNGHEGRLDSAEATVLTLVTDVTANTTLVNNLLSGLQIFGRSLTAVEANITTLRTDVDANTLSNTQFLNALQYQSTSIFAIDTAIQGLNVQVGSLETTYNTHIGGAFLAIRQNVDSNNLILGTLSTQTTSLLTAMTQLVPRVDNNESNVIVLFSAISTLGTTTEANRLNFEDLETRIEDLEAA